MKKINWLDLQPTSRICLKISRLEINATQFTNYYLEKIDCVLRQCKGMFERKHMVIFLSYLNVLELEHHCTLWMRTRDGDNQNSAHTHTTAVAAVAAVAAAFIIIWHWNNIQCPEIILWIVDSFYPLYSFFHSLMFSPRLQTNGMWIRGKS